MLSSTFTRRLQLNLRVLAIVPRVSWPGLWRRVFEVTYFCAGPCHRHQPSAADQEILLPGSSGQQQALYTCRLLLLMALACLHHDHLPQEQCGIKRQEAMPKKRIFCSKNRAAVTCLCSAITPPPVTQVHNKCQPCTGDACDRWEWRTSIPLPRSPSD